MKMIEKFNEIVTTRYGMIAYLLLLLGFVFMLIYALVWENDLGFWFGY